MDVRAKDLTVRLAEQADARAIAAIYNVEVTTSTVTFDLVPRSIAEQQEWIADHDGAHPATVAVDGHTGEIVGFGSLSQWRPRPAYATSVEDSVYVRGDQRGRGVGRLLLQDLIDRASAHGFHTVLARITGGHDASVGLHRACGFDVAGIERQVGRKFGRWLDVVIMQRMLVPGRASAPLRLARDSVPLAGQDRAPLT